MAVRRESFFLRHFAVSIGVLWGLIAIGIVVAAPLVIHLSLFKPDLGGHHVKAVADAVEAASPDRSPENVVARMSSAGGERAGETFVLDGGGNVLAGTADFDLEIDLRSFPKVPHQVGGLRGELPPPGGAAVVKLRGSPERYLIFRPGLRSGPERFMMLSIFGLSTIIVLGAMAWSTLVLLRKLRRHAGQAAAVMDRMENGELGARLPVEKRDEFGELAEQFNRMAGEVEALFSRVRDVEKSRVHLLQEIGHDLRTPLGSLLNILEILHDKPDRLSGAEKKELLTSGRREVKFTQRLVDDLLFLARVEDPSCVKRDEPLDLAELISAEAEAKRALSLAEIEVRIPSDLVVNGDPQLLRRLIQNSLANLISFAERKATVAVQTDGDEIRIFMDDDGPGFSEAALGTFGKKRPTRFVHDADGGRVSLGLGSVIMVAIAKLYGGEVRPVNRFENGRLAGGRILISLKIPRIESRRFAA